MGIGNDIAPKPPAKKPEVDKSKHLDQPEADQPKAEKPKLEPGEVEVGVSIGEKNTDDLYSDFLSDWDNNSDENEDHHHHNHLHSEEPDNDKFDQKSTKKEAELPEEEQKTKGGGLLKWIILFFVILTAIIVWQNYSKIAELFNFSSDEDSSDSAEEVTYYDNSTTDYTTPADDETATETDATADETAKTPAIDKSTISIQILNGNGTTGSGSIAKQILVDAGFTVSSTANAKRYNYATSIVYYKTGKEAEATLVNESLSAYVTELVNEDSVMGVYDVVIVIGAT